MRPKALAAVLALIMVATPAAASDIVVTGIRPGQVTYLRVSVSLDGVPTVSVVPSVSVDTTPTVPTDPPTDPGLTGLAKSAFAAAVPVGRPAEAAALAATYAAVAAELRSGNMQAVDAAEHTKTAVDTLLGVMGAADRWSGWRSAMGAEMGSMQIRTASDLAAAYESLDEGLRAAAGGANSAIDFAVIVKLVLAVISKDPGAIAEAVIALVQSLRG
jgi:hypothetical protein